MAEDSTQPDRALTRRSTLRGLTEMIRRFDPFLAVTSSALGGEAIATLTWFSSPGASA